MKAQSELGPTPTPVPGKVVIGVSSKSQAAQGRQRGRPPPPSVRSPTNREHASGTPSKKSGGTPTMKSTAEKVGVSKEANAKGPERSTGLRKSGDTEGSPDRTLVCSSSTVSSSFGSQDEASTTTSETTGKSSSRTVVEPAAMGSVLIVDAVSKLNDSGDSAVAKESFWPVSDFVEFFDALRFFHVDDLSTLEYQAAMDGENHHDIHINAENTITSWHSSRMVQLYAVLAPVLDFRVFIQNRMFRLTEKAEQAVKSARKDATHCHTLRDEADAPPPSPPFSFVSIEHLLAYMERSKAYLPFGVLQTGASSCMDTLMANNLADQRTTGNDVKGAGVSKKTKKAGKRKRGDCDQGQQPPIKKTRTAAKITETVANSFLEPRFEGLMQQTLRNSHTRSAVKVTTAVTGDEVGHGSESFPTHLVVGSQVAVSAIITSIKKSSTMDVPQCLIFLEAYNRLIKLNLAQRYSQKSKQQVDALLTVLKKVGELDAHSLKQHGGQLREVKAKARALLDKYELDEQCIV